MTMALRPNTTETLSMCSDAALLLAAMNAKLVDDTSLKTTPLTGRSATRYGATLDGGFSD